MNGQLKLQPGSATQEVLAGLVERVTFHNAENGFCVIRIKAPGHRELVTAVGHAATIAPASGSPRRANGSMTGPTASSSNRGSCARRRQPRPKGSKSISVPG